MVTSQNTNCTIEPFLQGRSVCIMCGVRVGASRRLIDLQVVVLTDKITVMISLQVAMFCLRGFEHLYCQHVSVVPMAWSASSCLAPAGILVRLTRREYR